MEQDADAYYGSGEPYECDALAWRLGRPRRIIVRVIGWSALVLAMLGIFKMSRVPAARDAMTSWATMGQLNAP